MWDSWYISVFSIGKFYCALWEITVYVCEISDAQFGNLSTHYRIDWLIISKFNGTSTPKGSHSAKTCQSTRKKCHGSTVWELHCLRTALCESIRHTIGNLSIHYGKSQYTLWGDHSIRYGEISVYTMGNLTMGSLDIDYGEMSLYTIGNCFLITWVHVIIHAKFWKWCFLSAICPHINLSTCKQFIPFMDVDMIMALQMWHAIIVARFHRTSSWFEEGTWNCI